MPNTTNYAEIWQKELLTIYVQNALTSPFFTSNVRWLGGKTFHFTQMSVSGFRNHTRSGKIQSGVYTQTDNEYTVTHDRSVSFLVDKLDVDESNETASIQKVAETFEKTQAVPEGDAHFFEVVSQKAITASLNKEVDPATYTKSNILDTIYDAINKVKRYRSSLIVYVTTDVMNLIEKALADKAKIQWTSISGLEFSLETRVATINGVPVMEVIDDDRFYTKFDYKDDESGGFAPNSTGRKISILVASTETCKTVKKLTSIYYFAPGTHTEGDGYLYQHREAWDTFVFPNGKDNKIDSVYVEYATE